MERCKTCRFWNNQNGEKIVSKHYGFDVGACRELGNTVFDNNTRHKTENDITTITFKHISLTLLYTREDFNCIRHEKRKLK